jgi:hypothetical protein
MDAYPKEIKSVCQRDICTPMFMATPFTRAMVWNQHNCPSADEQRKCSIDTQLILLNHKKDVLSFATRWI